MTKCLKSELRLVFRNSVSWILLVSKRIKRHNTICGTVLSITYFCKRGSHGDCPGPWIMKMAVLMIALLILRLQNVVVSVTKNLRIRLDDKSQYTANVSVNMLDFNPIE